MERARKIRTLAAAAAATVALAVPIAVARAEDARRRRPGHLAGGSPKARHGSPRPAQAGRDAGAAGAARRHRAGGNGGVNAGDGTRRTEPRRGRRRSGRRPDAGATAAPDPLGAFAIPSLPDLQLRLDRACRRC